MAHSHQHKVLVLRLTDELGEDTQVGQGPLGVGDTHHTVHTASHRVNFTPNDA